MDELQPLVCRYAELRHAWRDFLVDLALVLPNGEYFPDPFTKDASGVERLLRRVLGYAPLSSELEVRLGFLEEEESADGARCGSGACGTGAKYSAHYNIFDEGDGYRVLLRPADLENATALVCSLSRSAGALVLAESGEEMREPVVDTEIAATVCGYGALLTSGAAIYAKGCGGLRMHQATALSVSELAVLTALFARTHNEKTGRVRSHFGATQQEAWDQALAWVDSNRNLVQMLKDEPAAVASGMSEWNATQGFFSRLFARKEEPIPAPKTSNLTDEQRTRMLEARKLVDEALGE